MKILALERECAGATAAGFARHARAVLDSLPLAQAGLIEFESAYSGLARLFGDSP